MATQNGYFKTAAVVLGTTVFTIVLGILGWGLARIVDHSTRVAVLEEQYRVISTQLSSLNSKMDLLLSGGGADAASEKGK